MPELDEAEQRALLKQAHAVLKEDFVRLESAKRAIQDAIAAKKKELREIEETIEAATLHRDQRVEAMRQEQSAESVRVAERIDALHLELAALQSKRNKAETEATASIAALDAQIVRRRDHLATLNSTITVQESRLSAARAGMTALKASLDGASA